MGYNFSDKRFLVVEDDVVSGELLFESLKLQGAEVIRVNSGEKAIELLRKREHFDMVLMDVCLPGMDGYETTKMLHEIVPQIPIIAQTAFITEGQERNALQAGCIGFIAKPTKPAELFELIVKYL